MGSFGNTKIMMIQILNKLYDDGLVYKQVHPTLPLTIWNYSEKCQYKNIWNEHLLMCRGLVTDNEGNIIARPFKKFFNIEEGKHTPNQDFEVYTKLDGSLGILFYYQNQWVMATRGSFTSDQAIKGFEMLQKYDYKSLNKKFTYLFEILYQDNRIVVQYPFEDVFLLGMINTETGDEVNIHNGDEDIRHQNMIKNIGLKVVEKFDGIKDYSVLKAMVKDNEEGFVVRFSNGDRMKVKGEEYLRLHKIMTNISTTSVWGVLSTGGNFEDLLMDVPDEFFQKIKKYERTLRYTHFSISEDAGKRFDYFMYGKYNDKEPVTDKKEYAMWVLKQPQHLQPILFRMFDKKEYSSYIWKLIRPKFRKL